MIEYDRNNNDTYVDKFSDNIQIDTEIHMFRNDKAKVLYCSGIFGDFSVQSKIAAANNILRFPSPAKVGLPKIKDIKIKTFIPMSLVQRYNHNEENLTIKHKSPVFYDTKIDKFILMLDYRFMRDISISELNIDNKSIYNIYPDKKDKNIKYIGLVFNSIADLDDIKKIDCSFNVFFESYKFYKMSLQGGEKVIVIKFLSSENSQVSLFDHKTINLLGKSLTTRRFDFEYAVFIRFNNRYYFCDENGNIIQNSSIIIDKKNEQTKLEDLNQISFLSHRSESNLFVVPYSEQQLTIIDNLSKKLHSIHNELCTLFEQAIDPDLSLDLPVLSISKDSNDEIKRLTSDLIPK